MDPLSFVTRASLIVRVDIDDAMRERIEQLAAGRSVLNGRTLMDGEGNVAGFAGEEIVHAYLPFLTKDTDSRNWDFLTPTGATIDVKSKGNVAHCPRPDFDCTVPEYQVEAQKCDIYIFTRISKDLRCGWIKGWISKDRFVREAKRRTEGASYNNEGRRTRGNHLVLPANRLTPIEVMKNYFAQRVA